MRTVTFLVLLALAIGCSDESYDYDNQTETGGNETAGSTPEEQPDTPAAPAAQKASKEAGELQSMWRVVENAKDPAAVLAKTRAWEGRELPGDAYFFLALMYRKGEAKEKAAETFKKFVDRSPGDTNEKTGLYYLVECLTEIGRPADAEGYVKAFASKYAEQTNYLRSMESMMAQAYLAKDDMASAVPHYGQSFEMGDYYAGEEYVMGLWAVGKYDEARTAAGKLSTRASDDKETERAKRMVARAEKMGKPAPELKVEAWVNPEEFGTDQLEGKVVLAYFWTTGQINGSRKGESLIKPIYEKYLGNGLQVVGLSRHDHFDIVKSKKDEGMGTPEEIQNLKNWVFNIKTPWPLGLSPDDSNREAFVHGGIVPTIVLIGKGGKFRYYRQGSDPAGFKQIEMLVGKLVAE